MEFLDHRASAYAEKFSSPLSNLLTEIEQETIRNHPQAHMISGQVQGRLLEFICRMADPQNVLEIGTFTGFATLCMAGAMKDNSVVHTIELREEDAKISQQNFNRSGLAHRIKLHTGDARSIIPTLDINWDVVFIDADKVSYIEYYELTLPGIKNGGWIIADNVLFHGQVLTEEVTGKNARAIQAFNEHVAADNRVEQVLLTVRDGLMLIRKK